MRDNIGTMPTGEQKSKPSALRLLLILIVLVAILATAGYFFVSSQLSSKNRNIVDDNTPTLQAFLNAVYENDKSQAAGMLQEYPAAKQKSSEVHEKQVARLLELEKTKPGAELHYDKTSVNSGIISGSFPSGSVHYAGTYGDTPFSIRVHNGKIINIDYFGSVCWNGTSDRCKTNLDSVE